MKIAFITSQFPNYDDPGKIYATPFLYKYANEIVKMGHEVTIYHFIRKYPPIFNIVAKFLDKMNIKVFSKYIVNKKDIFENSYKYNGVNIYRYVFTKYVPHGKTSKKEIEKLENKIFPYIKKNSYDFIISDFIDPCLQVIYDLKKIVKSNFGQILHVTDHVLFDNKKYRKLLYSVDIWFLRKKSQENIVRKYVNNPKIFFMYSGIKEFEINPSPSFRREANNFLFVGMINKFKGIDTIIDAVNLYGKDDIKLILVGDGTDKDYFINKTKKLALSQIITFIPKIEHEKVFEFMNKSDFLVMISHETFGMVYVEAMSQGCIPIGAINEGIDGVVINEYNGFLSPLNDFYRLKDLIIKLKKMKPSEIENISRNAYNTACQMTDKKLSKKFLDFLVKYGEQK